MPSIAVVTLDSDVEECEDTSVSSVDPAEEREETSVGVDPAEVVILL